MAHYKKKYPPPNQTPKLVLNIGDTKKSHPEVTVFVGIDTSGSMTGPKINQVCSSLQDIISRAPGYARFVIRKFDNQVQTLVSKKKKYLDFERLSNELKICGHMTALYDAWGQIIQEIPYDVSKQDAVYILLFTDGCDNASKKFTMDAIIDLVNKTVDEKIHLIFIQAGSHKIVSNALEAKCSKKFCTIINVEDSVAGINYGFNKARQRITFEIDVDDASKFCAQIGGLTLTNSALGKGKSFGTWNQRNGNRGSGDFHRGAVSGNFQPPRGPNFLANPGNRNGAPRGFQGLMPFPPIWMPPPPNFPLLEPQKNPFAPPLGTGAKREDNRPNTKQSRSRKPSPAKPAQKSISARNVALSSLPMKTYNYPIKIGNIPADVTTKFPTKSMNGLLSTFFEKWGDCEVSQIETRNSMVTAIVSYESNFSKNQALTAGWLGRWDFHGTVLTVQT